MGFTVADELPAYFEGDSYRLRQVLLNLASNAIKFTPADGRVQVTVTPASSTNGAAPALRFEVRDTGIGMDAATVARIFERFTQADSSTTRRYGGSGLGLAISAQLVRLMEGQLEVESAPARGSCFHFTLTLPEAAPPAVEASVSDAQEGDLGLNVFVVEDNAVNRSILAAQLKQLGCAHTMARDGEEALALLSDARAPDLILMDCHMPKLDGWETTRRLRAWSRSESKEQQQIAALPIVALTAAALPEERQRCLEAGMDRFLAKPVRLAELRAMLVRCGDGKPVEAGRI
jgi:CheY-like chemotaxis protein